MFTRFRKRRGVFARLTEEARRAMAGAVQEARRFERDRIDTEHLLLGLLGVGVADRVPALWGATPQGTRERLEGVVGHRAQELTEIPRDRLLRRMPFTTSSLDALMFAERERRRREHDHIGVEHLLLGLLCEPGDVVAQLLTNMSVEIDAARGDVLERLREGPVSLSVRPTRTAR